MTHRKLQTTIRKYAEAYAALQEFQDSVPWIPGGDQKTGSIGEYFDYLYLASLHGESSLSYGSHSEKGWDIQVNANPSKKIQVKTVSAYSKTRTMSPIHTGWDELHIIYLSRLFEPLGFWIVSDNDIFGDRRKICGARCRRPDNERTGSAAIPFGENRVSELRTAIRDVQSP